MAKKTVPQHAVVALAWFDCPLCSSEIRAADAVSAQMIDDGASDQDILDAAHKPRFATLEAHARFMADEGWATII